MAYLTNVSQADPYADPAMLAFLRAGGAEEATGKLAIQNQKSQIARQIAASTPEYQDLVSQGLRNIGGSLEARGLYRSGERLDKQNDFQVGAARQREKQLQGFADQSTNLDLQLAQQIAQIRRQAAEQGVNSSQNIALQAAQAGVL